MGLCWRAQEHGWIRVSPAEGVKGTGDLGSVLTGPPGGVFG